MNILLSNKPFLKLGSFPEGDLNREMIEVKIQAHTIFHKHLQVPVLRGKEWPGRVPSPFPHTLDRHLVFLVSLIISAYYSNQVIIVVFLLISQGYCLAWDQNHINEKSPRGCIVLCKDGRVFLRIPGLLRAQLIPAPPCLIGDDAGAQRWVGVCSGSHSNSWQSLDKVE